MSMFCCHDSFYISAVYPVCVARANEIFSMMDSLIREEKKSFRNHLHNFDCKCFTALRQVQLCQCVPDSCEICREWIGDL